MKSKEQTEFGDFQTPDLLTRSICAMLLSKGFVPKSLIEPTCGIGNFVITALDTFHSLREVFAVELNHEYINSLKCRVEGKTFDANVNLTHANFFDTNWSQIYANLPKPVLILGNLPWVTNSTLGVVNSKNVPEKTNFQKHKGLEAITGKANFDISEWMLLKLSELIADGSGTIAMLCKNAVARKVFLHAAKLKSPLNSFSMFRIDAKDYFDASVNACLLVCSSSSVRTDSYDCYEYLNFDSEKADRVVGYRDGMLISDVGRFVKWRHLLAIDSSVWRSGVKHDCSKVMELRTSGSTWFNKLDEAVEVEEEFVFPMVKSSHVANGANSSDLMMVVPQKRVNEETKTLAIRAPKLWKYLIRHGELLDKRSSVIYKQSNRFSIFGVGPYTFSPWKVAISGFYKNYRFKVIGPVNGKPVILDDTCYFVPCQTERDARNIAWLLNSIPALEFLEALTFWDAKRPITKGILDKLSLYAVAKEFRKASNYSTYMTSITSVLNPEQLAFI